MRNISITIWFTFLVNLLAALLSNTAAMYLFIKSRMKLDKSATFLIIIFQGVFILKLINVSIYLTTFDSFEKVT